jgi:diketogulonate reductase-like aldo/keto reductase
MATETTSFQIAPDGIDPQSVPTFRLNTGADMPAIGLGTFGSDHVNAEEMASVVLHAAQVGYRHFDCAAVYANEPEIGQSLRLIMAGGVPRQELWITSKLWNDKHAEQDVIPACRKTLDDLGLDYLDLYLVHWPFPNHHEPGVSVESRDHHARAYSHPEFMRTWRQMEKLVDMGWVRAVGTSNMTRPKLEHLLADARIRPAVEEMELHPHFQQPELFDFVRANGIQPVGYTPIGSPARPDRDRTPDDTVDIEDPVIVDIARRHAVHPAVICLKWGVQRGQAVLPMSTNRRNVLANLRSVTHDPLSPDEMQAITTIDKNCRLIKGQVFLWKPGQPWQDLWDMDGVITPP